MFDFDAPMSREEGINTVLGGCPHVVLLGAGASIASTIRNPEPSGKKLPSMNDFIDIVGLKDVVEPIETDCKLGNFEDVFSCLYEKDPDSAVVREIERRIQEYFGALTLPPCPTIYDYLVLALRPKDLIATFNWDPFLFQAWRRSPHRERRPQLSFLHGNVAVGYSLVDHRVGPSGKFSKATGNQFTPTRLLYPVTHKNYNSSEFISREWQKVKHWLSNAKRITVFGYSAPRTDVEAIDLLSQGWGSATKRNMEQIELIDVQPTEVLMERWRRFIHTHHYECFDSYFDSSLAEFPRRTGERFVHQFMPSTPGEALQEANPVPQDFGTLEKLWEWHESLIAAEQEADGTHA